MLYTLPGQKLPPKIKVTLSNIFWSTFSVDYSAHSLWHSFISFCNVTRFISIQCCIQDLALMMVESGCYIKPSWAHPKDCQWGSGLESVATTPCVKNMSHALSQFEAEESWHCHLANMVVPSRKKKSIERKTCSFLIFNVVEPRPGQLQQSKIITLSPQACIVGTWYDGCITSSASSWNSVNLEEKKGFNLLGSTKVGLWSNNRRSCGLMRPDLPCSRWWVVRRSRKKGGRWSDAPSCQVPTVEACRDSAMTWGCCSWSLLG